MLPARAAPLIILASGPHRPHTQGLLARGDREGRLAPKRQLPAWARARLERRAGGECERRAGGECEYYSSASTLCRLWAFEGRLAPHGGRVVLDPALRLRAESEAWA